MNTLPRVSVVLPVYQRSSALRPTVDSILAQSFTDWELILVDDGSTDDTAAVCRSYQDPRVRYLRQENAGHAVARNRGFQGARGEYVAFLDHDDRWLPEKLALQVAHLDAHPHHGVVYGQWERINETGEVVGAGDDAHYQGEVLHDLLREGQFLWTMSLPMMRMEMVRQVGGFDPAMDTSDDHDLFLKLAQVTQFGFVPERVLQYNVGNGAQQSRQKLRLMRAHWRCLMRHLPLAKSLTDPERSAIRRRWRAEYGGWCRDFAWHSLRDGDASRAWEHYRAALEFQPRMLADTAFLRDLLALVKRQILGPRSGPKVC